MQWWEIKDFLNDVKNNLWMIPVLSITLPIVFLVIVPICIVCLVINNFIDYIKSISEPSNVNTPMEATVDKDDNRHKFPTSLDSHLIKLPHPKFPPIK